jgi:prephenate dehydrogenase
MARWNRVAIVGVGLIGGSLGLALRQRDLARSVVGIGRRASSLRRARELGAVTTTTSHLARGVAEADLVVICTPVAAIVPTALEVSRHCPSGALLTDVGSTKQEIVTRLERELNTRQGGARFIGSHPLAGSEKTGVEHARADLFVDRVVIVTPSPTTRAQDYDTLKAFWRSVGARVLRQSPQAHDRAVAAISHLPHLVASALAAGTPPDLLPLAAGGWLDTTRVAAGDVELWSQILRTNRQHVLKWLAKFEKVLTSFRGALETDDTRQLARLLDAGKRNRDALGN